MARPGAGSDKLDRGIVLIASVVVIGAIMSILDTTIVNVALATLSRRLHSPLSTIQVGRYRLSRGARGSDPVDRMGI